MKKIRKTGFARKTESVDRRIRQLLILKTYLWVCLFVSPPLHWTFRFAVRTVTRHNQDVFSKKKEGIKIRTGTSRFGRGKPSESRIRCVQKGDTISCFSFYTQIRARKCQPSGVRKGNLPDPSNLFVQTANILTNYTMLNGAPLFAAWGMGHALEREMHGPKVTGVCLVVHSIEPLGEHETAIFEPSQRLGAAFTFEKSRNGSDYAKGSTHLSLQPGATGHIRVSLIFELSEALHSVPNAVDLFLNFGKFSGGLITSYDAPALHDDRSSF